MVPVRVILTPSALRAEDIAGRVVVVFDVLRATTTVAAALSSGVREIRVFDSLDACRSAASSCTDAPLLCGETACLPPEGFDLGNSPGDYTPERCRGRMMYLSTTNGTRALHAAQAALRLFTGSIVNARATAVAVRAQEMPVTLLCAGTDGAVAMEDVLGCGAVMEHLGGVSENDEARMAAGLWRDASGDIAGALRLSRGGQNVIRAGLERDIDFAARLNSVDVACQVFQASGGLTVRACSVARA